MKLVIDANIGLKALVPEDHSEKALKLFDDSCKGVHELLAPDLYPIEVGNVLVIAARSGRIQESELPVMYGELMASLPIIYQSISLFPRAFDIASQSRVSVYDALYVALAEREGCDLVTADQRLLKSFTGQVSVISLSSL